MIPYIGDFAEDATIYHYFNTFDSNDPSASVTITNLSDTDIYVYKDGSVTDIVTDGATVVIDFDSRTGVHKLTIDTSVHADYAVGSDYMVLIEGTTVDAGTVTAGIFTFSIENRFNAAADDLANGTDGLGALKTLIDAIQTDLDNGTDGLGAIKSDTAAILVDTADIQPNYATSSALATAQADLDTITGTDGATLATAQALYAPAKAGDSMALSAGAVTNASLAGNMEIVFETDFATNYNTTRNAWATNAQDFVGTSAADPFNGQVVAASVTGAVGSVTGNVDGNVTGSVGSNLELGPTEVNAEVDTAIETYGLDHLVSAAVIGTDVTDNSIVAKLVSSSATADWDDFVNTSDSLQATRDHIGDGTNLTEAGGTGDHLTALATAAALTTVDNEIATIDTVVDGIQTDLDNGTDGLGALKTLIDAAQTDLDTLTDTSAEPTGVPAASATLLTKVGYLYMALRNQVDVTATKKTFYDDSGTAEWEKDLSDNGTTYSESEGNAI